jgi:hypothetical protein
MVDAQKVQDGILEALRNLLDRPYGFEVCQRCQSHTMVFRFAVGLICRDCAMKAMNKLGMEIDGLNPMQTAPYAPGVTVWALIEQWEPGLVVARDDDNFTVSLYETTKYGGQAFLQPDRLALRNPALGGADRPQVESKGELCHA